MTDELPDDERHLRSRSTGWLRFRNFVLIPGGLLLLCIALTVSWLVLRDRTASSKVQAEIDRLNTNQLPYDNRTLSTYYDSLTTTKNLDRWLSLLKKVESEPFKTSSQTLIPWNSDEDVPPAGQIWPDEARHLSFLNRCSALVEEAESLALEDVKRRVPIQFDSFLTDHTRVDDVRQVARLLQLEAQLAMRAGDSERTCTAILAILGCARSVDGQPLAIGQMISAAVEGVAYSQIKLAVERNCLEREDIQSLIDRLKARAAWQSKWQIIINGERATTIPAFKEPRRYLGADLNGFSPSLVPLRNRDMLSFLQYAKQAAELTTDNLTAFNAAAAQLELDMEGIFRPQGFMAQFDHVLCFSLMPSYRSLSNVIIQQEMQARLVTIGLGIRMYEKQYGNFPKSLDELASVGLDVDSLRPMGDKPFGYRVSEDGQSIMAWGFRTQSDSSTPDEPMEKPDGGFDWGKIWVWRLRK